jgi:hypothetical protein
MRSKIVRGAFYLSEVWAYVRRIDRRNVDEFGYLEKTQGLDSYRDILVGGIQHDLIVIQLVW